MKATNNVIELRPYLQPAREPFDYRGYNRRAVKRARRAAFRYWITTAMDVLCYLTLLVCLIIGALVLITMV